MLLFFFFPLALNWFVSQGTVKLPSFHGGEEREKKIHTPKAASKCFVSSGPFLVSRTGDEG
jgi:hypothetical protein